MVYAGTQTVKSLGGSGEVIEILTEGLDADGEVGGVIDIFNFLNKFPTDLLIYANTTHATAVTDIVDVAVQGSYFGTIWADVGTSITDADEGNGGSAAEDSLEILTDVSALPYRYYRPLCTTVGSGNTIALSWRLGRGG